jgi:hypothetical protein
VTTNLKTIYNDNGTLDLVVDGNLYVNCKVGTKNGADVMIDADARTIEITALTEFTYDHVIIEEDRAARLKGIGASL